MTFFFLTIGYKSWFPNLINKKNLTHDFKKKSCLISNEINLIDLFLLLMVTKVGLIIFFILGKPDLTREVKSY